MRVTQGDIEAVINVINDKLDLVRTGEPFVLDAAYGGYRLNQRVKGSTGEREITSRMSGRELWRYLDGLRFGLSLR